MKQIITMLSQFTKIKITTLCPYTVVLDVTDVCCDKIKMWMNESVSGILTSTCYKVEYAVLAV